MEIRILFTTILLCSCFLFACQPDQKATQADTATTTTPSTAAQPKATPPPASKQKAKRPAPSGPPLILVATNKTVKKGKSTCIDINTSAFQNIMSMQYTMQWDPAVLTFEKVAGFGLPGMTNQSFGASHASKGILAYSWYDSNVQGISLNDGTLLYQVCFNVVGETGSRSDFKFIDRPVVKEITNKAGAFLELQHTDGQIKVQ